jgi:RNA polymerase sigma-70 factor (ECF subfamily)
MFTTPPTLLQRLRQPNAGPAWQRFVAIYTPLFLCWACRLGAQRQDAEDLLQDYFIKLHKELPRFDHDQDRRFRGWLWTLFRHTWSDRKKPGPAGNDHELGGLAAPDELESRWTAEDLRLLVQRAAAVVRRDFDEETWRAFWLFVVEDCPAAEVARTVGVSVNKIYIAKCRVLKRLRLELAEWLE